MNERKLSRALLPALLVVVVGLALAEHRGRSKTVPSPEVTLRCPAAGYLYNPGDIVPIAADVRGLGQAVVEFEINGKVIALDTSHPFETTYVIGRRERGGKRLVAIARDPEGHVTRSTPMDIGVGPLRLVYQELNVDDISAGDKDGTEPTVTLRAPVRGTVFCHAPFVQFVADVRGVAAPVARVDFEIDGRPIATLTKPPFTYKWAPPVAGRHAAAVRATDADGRVGVTPRVMLLVIGSSRSDETKAP